MICKVVVMTSTSLQVSNVSFKRHFSQQLKYTGCTCTRQSVNYSASQPTRGSFTIHCSFCRVTQRRNVLSAHSLLIIIKELPVCTLDITFWSQETKLISINLDTQPLQTSLLLSSRQASQSSTECKYFNRRLDSLEISSKNNKSG